MLRQDFPKCDVVLTYGWCRVAYIVLRSLTRHGLRVLIGDEVPIGMCQMSKLKADSFRYPSPWTRPGEFVKEVKRVFSKSEASVIIAPHEESYLLVQARNEFPEKSLAAYPPWEAIKLLNDKQESTRLAESLEIPVPRTVGLDDSSSFASQVSNAELDYPCVVKLKRGNSAKGVFYPKSDQELEHCVLNLIGSYKLSQERYPLVQEYVKGEGWGVSGVWNHGQPLALVTHRRLREKTATGGTSTLREVRGNSTLEEYTLKLMREVEWHGAAMVEYKYNPQTHQAWFMEVNPRLWGSLTLSVAAGLDIPWIIYNLAVENPIVGPKPQEGTKSRWILGDLIAAVDSVRRGEIGSAFKALKPVKATSYDDWYLDDPMAFAGQAAYYAWKFLRSGFNANPVEEGMLG
jgi:predicted ATP-grasp superfamily ATP-dependent carboligase